MICAFALDYCFSYYSSAIVLPKNMGHVQIAIDGDVTSWKQRCNERITRLRAQQFSTLDQASHSTLLQENLLSEKRFIAFELFKAVKNGDVDSFLNVLEEVSAEKKLSLSTIFDQVSRAGSSLLHVAAHFGSENIAELIVQEFPELLVKRNIRGDTALHVAARAKHYNVVQIILSQYAAEQSEPHAENDGVKLSEDKDKELPRMKNEYGNTALHEAVYSNHFDGVACLYSADHLVAHSLNKLGKSPLYLAVLASDDRILSLLLQAPFEKGKPLPRSHGNSPLHAAILERNSALMEAILESGSELMHLVDEKGGTPLHYAASLGDLKGVQILLNKSSSSALAWNTKGHLPIHVACKKGHVEVVKALLQLEWPTLMDQLSKKGQNILHVAAKNGQDNVVKYILREKKFEQHIMNERDRSGNTPLHLASKHLYPKVLLSLTRDKRVDLHLMNNEGLTAQDIVLVRSRVPLKHREFLSLMILYSAGVPRSEKAASMLRRRKQPPKIDWIKDRINTLMLVAILIATVTFAAGFTLPGGVYSSDDLDPNKRGMAVLVDKAMFQVFTVCNTLAMYSSTVGSFILLWAQLGDFHLAGSAYNFALHMVGMALVTTSVAFMAAVRLAVSKVTWLANVITIIGIIFLLLIVFVYILLIFPLGVRHPLMRYVANFLIRILIPFAGSYDKVIAKEQEESYSQQMDKGKQEELSEIYLGEI